VIPTTIAASSIFSTTLKQEDNTQQPCSASSVLRKLKNEQFLRNRTPIQNAVVPTTVQMFLSHNFDWFLSHGSSSQGKYYTKKIAISLLSSSKTYE